LHRHNIILFIDDIVSIPVFEAKVKGKKDFILANEVLTFISVWGILVILRKGNVK